MIAQRGARTALAVGLVAALGLHACSREEAARGRSGPPVAPANTVWVEIGRELFELELALDPETRFRGLGGRRSISPSGGMLFVNSTAQPSAMVMRDCPIPIDVAFLDDNGRVVGSHAMRPEPPRGDGESAAAYEARLPIYRSDRPARFAVETAGGRLAELGVGVGDLLVFDTRAVLEKAGFYRSPRAKSGPDG